MIARWFCILSLGLLLGACGGGDDGNSSAPIESRAGISPNVGAPDRSGGTDGEGDADGDQPLSPAPGPLTGIQFDGPTEIAADAKGNLYVLDREGSGQRIRQIAPDGEVTTLASTDEDIIGPLAVAANGDLLYGTTIRANASSSDMRGMIWRLAKPSPGEVVLKAVSLGESVAADMVVDPASDELYLAIGQAVWRLDQEGDLTKLVEIGMYPSLALQGDTLWISVSDGRYGSGMYRWREGEELEEVLPYENTRYIHDLVFANEGLYFTSHVWDGGPGPRLSCVVNLLAPATGEVTTVAGAESEECGYQDGTGQSAKFASGARLTVAGDENLYVADFNNDVLRKVTPAGEVTTYAGVPRASGN